MSEYERQLIVARTTRGTIKAIDEGKRSYPSLYCYKKNGKDEKGYVKWELVESEAENYKYILKRYNEGATLRTIFYELHEMNRLTVSQNKEIQNSHMASYASNMGTILRKYQYTGWQLTFEGKEIYNQFRKNEIQSIRVLLDKEKYWVKSIHFPVEMISIEDWVDLVERLQSRGQKMNESRKERTLKANKDIATGIIECGDCGLKFYYHYHKSINRKGTKSWDYWTYFHHTRFNGTMCKQNPKSFKREYINEIFKLFFFYFYLVFDDTNERIRDSQRNIKQTRLVLDERIKKVKSEITKCEKNIEKCNRQFDKTNDDDVIKQLMKMRAENENKIIEKENELRDCNVELETQNEKYQNSLMENAFVDVTERINHWFSEKTEIEEKREMLRKAIEKCKVFNHHLIIDTGKTVFLFDIDKHYNFDMKLLENLNKGEVYKNYFLNGMNEKEARAHEGRFIVNINLDRHEKVRLLAFKYLNDVCGVVHNLNGKRNLVSFTFNRMPYTIECIDVENLKVDITKDIFKNIVKYKPNG